MNTGHLKKNNNREAGVKLAFFLILTILGNKKHYDIRKLSFHNELFYISLIYLLLLYPQCLHQL